MKLSARLALWTSLVAAGPAMAAVPAAGDTAPRQLPSDLVQLAQAREAEVFIDRDGNQVLVDSVTGQVISRRPATRRQLQEQRQRQRQTDRQAQGSWDDDGYYRAPRPRAQVRDPYYDDYRYREREETYGYGDAPRDSGRGGWDDETADFPETPREQPPAQKPAKKPTLQAVRPTQPTSPHVAPPQEPDVQLAEREPVPTNPAIIEDPTMTGSVSGSVKPNVSVPTVGGAREDVASLQVLLDRFGASPGVIDGRFGLNVDKAIVNFNAITGQRLKSTDTALVKELLASSGGDAFTTYTITPEDVAGPYVASVPADYSEKAKLERLSFTSVPEALAERFHMDENYLRALNSDANFNRAGTIIRVVNPGKPATKAVVRIIADKGNRQVRGYSADGKLVVAYPASIGSTDTPSPSGVHNVSRVALNPGYTYNPKINFKQGTNDKILTLPPGPNGPVGSVWIALDKPTYGIHGTPEPSKIGRGESHGCVRLTNWDATELAKIVKSGVPVEFIE